MSGSNAGDYANARKGKTKQAGKVGGRPAPFFHNHFTHSTLDTSYSVLEVHLLLLCDPWPWVSEWCEQGKVRGALCEVQM